MKMRRLVVAVLSVAFWLPICPAAPRRNPQPACEACHQNAKLLPDSVHAAVGCAACHAGREQYPHSTRAKTAACATCHPLQGGELAASVHRQTVNRAGMETPACTRCHGAAHAIRTAHSAEFRKSVPETCGACHSGVANEFRASIHGVALSQGILQAAVCTDCHGEHSIQRPSAASSLVNTRRIRETCGRCHGDVQLSRKFGFPPDRLISYDASYHGLAARTGSQIVANCASCHGVHNILPSSDPKSTVYPHNLRTTCGHCHRGAGTRFAIGPVHVWPGRTEPASVRRVRTAYLTLIPFVVGLMFVHNAGDWLRKLIRLRSTGGPTELGLEMPSNPGLRMYRFERIQHGVLVGSFLTLALTGFLLRYPGQWWAQPFVHSIDIVRGTIHRGAAVLFIAAALSHLVSLIANRGLRNHWRELLPAFGDVKHAARAFAYNLGLAPTPPRLSQFTYIDKLQYWAAAWGFITMLSSGLLLWANTFVLARMPKEVLDVATAVHFYEAVFGCLVLIVWHIYRVVLDPDVYPMNPSWITGRTGPEQASE